MEALKVGIREFREKSASYLLESDVPVAITRHGDTVGYYVPAQRKRAETERAGLKEAAVSLCSKCSLQKVSLRKRSGKTSNAGAAVSASDGTFLIRVAVTQNAHFAGFDSPFCGTRKRISLNT